MVEKIDSAVVLFDEILRIHDHHALYDACKHHDVVIPVYVHHPSIRLGSAKKWWHHYSLISLNENLHEKKSRLIIRQGDLSKELLNLLNDVRCSKLYLHQTLHPLKIKKYQNLIRECEKQKITVNQYPPDMLFKPDQILNQQNNPYKVYTHYRKACLHDIVQLDIKPVPTSLKPITRWPKSLKINELHLLPEENWSDHWPKIWSPGELQAKKQLNIFIKNAILDYSEKRDFPSVDATSKMSVFLANGDISSKYIWAKVVSKFNKTKQYSEVEAYLKQLVWREFAYYILWHFPHTLDKPLYDKYSAFPWKQNQEELKAWQTGKTGYPIVDAGMRQLWHTGFMHNRLRMIVGSFLVKDLLIHWHEGAHWFEETLLDADDANNTLGWQWVAGCGADAAPYFRIFNPITQGEKFDKAGEYVRTWLPELKNMPDKFIHQPWNAPEHTLKKAGVELGINYPKPIIDHKIARERALKALYSLK
ncbi:Deoxyribodipyrimidine photo-lyase [Poriferisphaera corsica]|uniref:Deoxyribodipyrimidine photo-lyase n=1 Tax=Poriferisphaera corsica TaxID=2528020 RepID=A0A517YVC5_9BACT|nr:deoxyribodipyrimidine photo-lyase [Poriferisphaera corsica]QDU34174.1 Deoxyribodipyrimidine photo-lyase [Poriferisphaera corsica]